MAEDWEDFMNILEYRVDMCHDILDIHRKLLTDLIADGRQPLYSYGFMRLERQFNTVGFIGLYEALEMQGFDITTEAGSAKAMEILNRINDMNAKRSQKTGNMYNLEQTPGESAAVTFAKKDKLQFSDAKYKLYSNQYIPLSHTAGLSDRIIAQGKFDKSVGGGSILHINVDEDLTPGQVEKLIRFSAESGVVYFAINLSICKCLSCGKTFTGRYDKSPCHQADVQRFLRIVGYLTPVETWSEARREEYKLRQFYGSDVF
jgi:ribonucleoside-triphosphate reductase